MRKGKEGREKEEREETKGWARRKREDDRGERKGREKWEREGREKRRGIRWLDGRGEGREREGGWGREDREKYTHFDICNHWPVTDALDV